MHPKPTNGSNADYPTRVGNAIDALDRRLKGNYLDNGAFQVWQRGTSIVPGAATYVPDRWQVTRSVAGSTASRQAGASNQYALRVQRDSGNASTTAIIVGQSIESIDCYGITLLPCTLKFKARCGATYTPTSSILAVAVISGTGSDQNVITGFTGANSFISQSASLGTGQQTFEYSGTIPSGTTQLGVKFTMTPVGTASTNDWFELEEVQLVIGDFAGNFPYRTYGEEIARCQRFLPGFNSSSTNSFIPGGGAGINGTSALLNITFPVQARVPPTGISMSAVTHLSVNIGSTSIAATNVVFNAASNDAGTVAVTVAAGLAAGVSSIPTFNSASGRLLFTGAEL